jgi:hypothetical protein
LVYRLMPLGPCLAWLVGLASGLASALARPDESR